MTWHEELTRLVSHPRRRWWWSRSFWIGIGLLLVLLVGVVWVGWPDDRGVELASKPAGLSDRASPPPISLGFYPGWVDYSPDQVDYSAWTHIGHFGIYPNPDGTLRFGDLGREDLTPAVQTAQAAGVKILLVIGSEGTREAFLGATEATNLGRFVQEIVALATEHGYDGIDIAWSDEVDRSRFAALIRQLRHTLDATAPHLLLTFNAVSGLLPADLAAELHQYVDYIHLMSFWSDGADELTTYTAAGVPVGKLTVGIGLYLDGYHDTTVARVQSKVDLAQSQGAAGVMVWSFQHLDDGWDDPRLEPLRAYVSNSR